MSLSLGKTFDHNYNVRCSLGDDFVDVGVYFTKQTPFLLFDVNKSKNIQKNLQIKMFKKLAGSMFCESFLDLHNYRNKNLDIFEQFVSIKNEFTNDIKLTSVETIQLDKKIINEDQELYDKLIIYTFKIPAFENDFMFMIAERQSIHNKLNKKFVRSNGLQIYDAKSISFLEELKNI